ncbi:MAG: squalene/phytoene synthase family protein [Pirellulaceae bacterium]|nr:squalene/phytoene synthase family protein [Pirellulaceae bacterium]
MLPAAVRKQVGVAYLLFRVADTIEDSTTVGGREKLRLLGELGKLLQAADEVHDEWKSLACVLQQTATTNNAADACLFRQTARVVASACYFEPTVRTIILRRVRKSALGMRQFLSRGNVTGNIRLNSHRELCDYCYCVAGTVGEMLTELFLQHDPQLASSRSSLMSDAVGFGEALQLVNILKDSDNDHREGRCFIPANVARESLMEQARAKIEVAENYIQTLIEHDADDGIIRFSTFPVLLASLTLERVQADGPGAKVCREDVFRILGNLSPPNSIADEHGVVGEPKA